MRIDSELKLGFKDVFIRPKRSTLKSRSDVSLNRKFTFRHSGYVWSGVPVMAANMDTVGTFNMAAKLFDHELHTAVHKHYSLSQWQEFLNSAPAKIFDHIAVSSGISENDFKGLSEIIQRHPELKFICIDVANGYTEFFVDYVRKIRQTFPDKVLIAGNVVTGEMVEELILSGADLVKVGIGPGSVCTTRLKTGVGYPQISAIIECADAAHGLGGHIISDGGCTCPGDVAKAFGAGADFVMLGGMLAGHDESQGEMIEDAGKKFMEFYGMSSATAMDKHNGGVADYRASEGKAVRIPYRGPVEHTLQDILGGLRSACTYVGAASLKELSKRTTFIQVREQENQIFS
jgi:GMP reductase